ncbi:DUF2357 domain-containing protein [Gillisia limnaea]|uniref:DUF2357 domain-containing protein n=1 Tax=Gillisia limnaea (strain DSM 15749 / LMG 21470 / R-8282) TaxID=865937 RepID=H2BW12_GILLR|nr:DUF2357 domain-containing protein [Gillisia limnaea]EHQ02929.1 protein of unknown function DUF2357-containing protein [Gillisia limnaea DSM 15749]
MPDKEVNIPLDSVEEGLFLHIKAKAHYSVFKVEDAEANGEAPFQIKEGNFYHYKFSSSSYYFKTDEIVEQDPFNKHQGRISPNIYVGTLSISLFRKDSAEQIGKVNLEVQSQKTSYREDYRFMLENITEHCTDLLMQVNSPVSQNFEPDFTKGSETLYQRYTFIKSVIDTDEFNEAAQRVITSPNTAWCRISEESDIRKIGKFKNHHVRQFLTRSQRTRIREGHNFSKKGITSLPARVQSDLKTETVDTAENRFIKHALQSFLKLCNDIKTAVKSGTRIEKEVTSTIEKLEQHLHHTFFSEISRAQILKLNSPILQKKEGYREVLKAWLMFDLAAQLIWKGGENVYASGKKDIATLYEYWLFFKLLDLLKELFEIFPKDLEDLIKPTNDELSLQLAMGEKRSIGGLFEHDSRKLQINFSFNRTFSNTGDHPSPGSWSKSMRPDYTLSVWPAGISEETAEKEELIVHIHFDAKYKIDNLIQIVDQDKDLNQEKIEQLKGNYKNADLLKMHAYKDAIRRTGGAYVLYPGTEVLERNGFHEILPGLGAFPVRPSRTNSGIEHLKDFILRVIDHFLNRASQRENLAYRIFDIHRNPPEDIKEPLPEAFGENRNFIPSEIHVLVGFYKDNQHLQWIESKNLYNIRIDDKVGAIPLTATELSAKYILLHTSGDKSSNKLYKIKGCGPRIFSREKMITEGYPKENSYLIFEIEEIKEEHFIDVNWSFRNLPGYRSGRQSGIPFCVTLTELMKVVI